MQSVTYYRKIFENYKAKKELLLEQQEKQKIKREKLQKVLDNNIKARYILSIVSKDIQQNLIDYIENMVTKVLNAVFPNRSFQFLVNTEIKRNKAEISFKVYEGETGVERCVMLNSSFIPTQEEGGGLVDVISFALRPVVWSLEEMPSQNVMILDEPFRFLGGMELERTSQILREMNEGLQMQFIINTHLPYLATLADKAFFVAHDGVKSLFSEVNVEDLIEVSQFRDWEERLAAIVFPNKEENKLVRRKLSN